MNLKHRTIVEKFKSFYKTNHVRFQQLINLVDCGWAINNKKQETHWRETIEVEERY